MRSVKLACGAILLVGLFAAVAAAQGRPRRSRSPRARARSRSPPGRSRPVRPQFSAPRAARSSRLTRHPAGRSTRSTSCGSAVGSDPTTPSRLVFIEGGARRCPAPRPAGDFTVDLRPNVSYVLDLAWWARRVRAHAASPPRARRTARRRRRPTRRSAWSTTASAARRPCRATAHPRRQRRAPRGTSPRPSRCARARAPGASAAPSAAAASAPIGRVVAGAPVSVQDLISPGTVNDNEITFQRAGRYALVCFFGEHNRLGMYRIVRVR